MSQLSETNAKCGGCNGTCCTDPASIQKTYNMLREHYNSQLEVCELLEDLADSLPCRPHEIILKSVLQALKDNWQDSVFREEEKLFKAFEKSPDINSVTHDLIHRLRLERQAEIDHVAELVAKLERVLESNSIRNAEAFGYMLRCVFGLARRQVGIKLNVLMPAAKTSLLSGTLNTQSNLNVYSTARN